MPGASDSRAMNTYYLNALHAEPKNHGIKTALDIIILSQLELSQSEIRPLTTDSL